MSHLVKPLYLPWHLAESCDLTSANSVHSSRGDDHPPDPTHDGIFLRARRSICLWPEGASIVKPSWGMSEGSALGRRGRGQI